MIQAALLFLLVIAGCSHYEEKQEEVQIGTTFFYNPDKTMVPTYPFPLLVSPLELDDSIQKGRWEQGNCSFKLLAAQWLYYHQQQILADKIIKKMTVDPHCEILHEQALWWDAWSDQQKTYWNSSMLTLAPIVQDPNSRLYAPAYSSFEYAYEQRNTSAANLSTQEQDVIHQAKNYTQWLEQLPSPEVFEAAAQFPQTQSFLNLKYQKAEPFERLLVIYEGQLSELFVTQLFEHFEKQKTIKELYLVSADHDRSLISQLLEQKDKKTFLIAYQLNDPRHNEWLLAADASLTVGTHFYPQRNHDYHLGDSQAQFLTQIDQSQYLLRPQLIIYDQQHEHLLDHPLNQSVSYKLKINHQDYQDALLGLLAVPQRQALFQNYFPQGHYISQPRSLPYQTLLLLEPSLLRLSYPFLRYHQQERVLFIAPPGSLTTIHTLDSCLSGIVTAVPPKTRLPTVFSDGLQAQDLLAIVRRWPWFQYYQGYIYEGQLGRYRLKDQELICEWDMVVYQQDKG